MTIVLMPAAGKGQRFRDAGFMETVKPLIEFKLPTDSIFTEKKPMYQHALEGTNAWQTVVGFPADRVCQIRQGIWTPIAEDGRELGYYGVTCVSVQPNGGQLDTITELLSYVVGNDNEDILVLNSDVSFRNDVLPIFVNFMKMTNNYDAGAIVVRREIKDVESYSFVDGCPNFAWASEREWLSPWALAGAYWFRTKKDLMDAIIAVNTDADPDNDIVYLGESYLSHAISKIADPMLAFPIADENYLEFGTPDKLKKVLER